MYNVYIYICPGNDWYHAHDFRVTFAMMVNTHICLKYRNGIGVKKRYVNLKLNFFSLWK